MTFVRVTVSSVSNQASVDSSKKAPGNTGRTQEKSSGAPVYSNESQSTVRSSETANAIRCPVTVVVEENDGGPKQPPQAKLVAGASSSAHDTDVAIATSWRARVTASSPAIVPESLG